MGSYIIKVNDQYVPCKVSGLAEWESQHDTRWPIDADEAQWLSPLDVISWMPLIFGMPTYSEDVVEVIPVG